MVRLGWARLAAPIAASIAFASAAPAFAQDEYQLCVGSRQVGACTSLIQSGNLAHNQKALAEVYEARAEAQLGSNPEGASQDIDEAIRLDPSYYRPWGMRAAVKRFFRHDNVGALADASRALELDPSIAGNWALRGDIYADLDQDDRARADYARAHSIDPRLGNNAPPDSPPAAPAPANVAAAGNEGNVWGKCVALEDPVRSGIQMIYSMRNRCTKTITVSFCMKATYEAAGDWNLCSRRSYKTYDIRAGDKFEFPFTPVEPGAAMSDGRVVDRNEVSASGAACVGSSPSVYVENGTLMFQHC